VVTDRTALGDRIKRYEQPPNIVLPRRTYTLVRVDGRAFHTYLRKCEKPFDADFAADMDNTAIALCKEMAGVQFAYVQSDEISVLLTDFATPTTQPWFGGEVQKMVSIAASTATLALHAQRGGPSIFDARVFTIPDPIEVGNYFIWRQRDCVRNSISSAAQSFFSHKELHGVSCNQMQEKLFTEKGVNWNDYPSGFKRGRLITKVEDLETKRTFWQSAAAPTFTLNHGEFLPLAIPPMPSYSEKPFDLARQANIESVNAMHRKAFGEKVNIEDVRPHRAPEPWEEMSQ
jgi:tRNA(His) 5'-end guanylyltransferase